MWGLLVICQQVFFFIPFVIFYICLEVDRSPPDRNSHPCPPLRLLQTSHTVLPASHSSLLVLMRNNRNNITLMRMSISI